MDQPLKSSIEATIAKATGESASIQATHTLGGGCINHAFQIRLSDNRSFFVKTNQHDLLTMFRSESQGLDALRQTNTIGVPAVVGQPQTTGRHAYLVLDWIESGKKGAHFNEKLGIDLANLHRASQENEFGFFADNFLGSSPQPNPRAPGWVEFFRAHRLGFQLQLAEQNGFGSELQRAGRRLLDRLDEFLAHPEKPSLIHGDLWSGNYLADKTGKPVVIDPAAYWADREAEFGMITLFGGVDHRFYEGYQSVWPLSDGYSERFEIYKLYHVLNHLNLFGSGYLSQCLSILKKFV